MLPSAKDLRLTQCGQIGQFFKFLETNFVAKLTQMYINFLGYIEKHNACCGDCLGSFWNNLGYFLFHHLITLGRALRSSQRHFSKIRFICAFLQSIKDDIFRPAFAENVVRTTVQYESRITKGGPIKRCQSTMCWLTLEKNFSITSQKINIFFQRIHTTSSKRFAKNWNKLHI